MILIGKDVNEGYWRRGSHLGRGFVHAPCAKIGQILSVLSSRRHNLWMCIELLENTRSVAQPSQRRIPSCEAGTRYPVPSVWVVLRDGGFFACSCLSMRLSGSFYFATANELVELYAQNLFFNPERINGATGSSCVAFVWRTHL